MFLAMEFNDFMPWFWVIVLFVTILFELLTTDIMCIWFSIGSIFSLVSTIFKAPIWLQFVIFAVVSLTLIFTLGKYTKKLLNGKEETNVDALVGQDIFILKDTSNKEIGEGKINGLIWSTICEEDEIIKENEYALVVRISGNKLIIKSKKKGN